MNLIDLTWLAQVKSFAEVKSSADDQIISDQITSFSRWVLTYCGKDTLNSVQSFTEVYNGNGQRKMFLRNSPIQSLVSVTVGPLTLPLSTGFNVSGVAIDQSMKSIVLICGSSGVFSSNVYPPIGGLGFTKGLQNVQVSYTAGYPPQNQIN